MPLISRILNISLASSKFTIFVNIRCVTQTNAVGAVAVGKSWMIEPPEYGTRGESVALVLLAKLGWVCKEEEEGTMEAVEAVVQMSPRLEFIT